MEKTARLLVAFLAVLAVMGLLLTPGISIADQNDNNGNHYGNDNNNNGNNGNHFGQTKAVPEPLTIILLGSGLVGLAVMRRRIKK